MRSTSLSVASWNPIWNPSNDHSPFNSGATPPLDMDSYQAISSRMDTLIKQGRVDIFCGQQVLATFADNEVVSWPGYLNGYSADNNTIEDHVAASMKYPACIRWNPRRFDLVATHALSADACAVTLFDKQMQKVIWVASAQLVDPKKKDEEVEMGRLVSLKRENKEPLDQLMQVRSVAADICILGINSSKNINVDSERVKLFNTHGFQGDLAKDKPVDDDDLSPSFMQDDPCPFDSVLAAAHPQSGINSLVCQHVATEIGVDFYSIEDLDQQYAVPLEAFAGENYQQSDDAHTYTGTRSKRPARASAATSSASQPVLLLKGPVE